MRAGLVVLRVQWLDSFSVLDRAVACMRGRMKAIFFMFELFDRPICTVRVVLLISPDGSPKLFKHAALLSEPATL